MDTQDVLQELAHGFSSVSIGREFFRSLAKYLSKALGVDHVFVGELVPEEEQAGGKPALVVRSEVFFSYGQEAGSVAYPLLGSLCKYVVDSTFCAFPSQVQQLFPDNQTLKRLDVDSYAGIALFDSSGVVSGLIYVMHSGPITNVAQTESVLRIAAKRAELELDRARQDRKLQETNANLLVQLAERRKAEAQLRAANEELLRTQALLRQLNEQLEGRVAQRTEELQRANERVESIFMQAPVAIAIYQCPGYVVELANQAMCDVWGSNRETVLGRPLFEVLPQLRSQGYQERLDGVRATGQSFVGNEIAVENNRKQMYLKVVHQPLRDKRGSVTSIITVAHQVTELVLARKKTEASEARVQRLLDSIPQMTWTASREGAETYISQMWYQYTGVKPGQSFMEAAPLVVHPEDVPRAQEEWNRSIAKGEPYQVEYRFRRHDGEYRWMLSRALPIRNESGEITEWVGTATDIHEQKMAVDFLYTVLEGIPHMAWTSLPGTGINYFNKRWYEYTGLTEAQSLEAGWQHAVHPDDLPLATERRTAGRSKGEAYEVENRYRRAADGSYCWHLARVVPIRDEAGNITLWVGTATDIHAQKTAQHELENTLRELHEKNFELDQFVYKTSHDLRSPLSTILGLVDILKLEQDQTVKEHYVDLIENRVHKLDRFIRSMLDYSRNTRTQTGYEKIDLEGLVKECFADLEYMKHFARLRHTFCLEGDTFYSDVFRLKIICSNLISNAIKYQDFNKSESRLSISVKITPERAVLEFADNGVGIEPAYQGKVFDMFFRAAEQSDGSGLGLYIVKQAVAVLDGGIALESSTGAGTRFAITLPNAGPA